MGLEAEKQTVYSWFQDQTLQLQAKRQQLTGEVVQQLIFFLTRTACEITYKFVWGATSQSKDVHVCIFLLYAHLFGLGLEFRGVSLIALLQQLLGHPFR